MRHLSRPACAPRPPHARGLFAHGLLSLSLIVLGLGAPGGGARAEKPAFNGMQTRLLDRGSVLVTTQTPTNNEGVAALAVGVIDAPLDRVWPVVRDCEHFHKFMPRTKSSKLLSKNGDTMECHIEISMPFPLSNLWSDTITEVKPLAGGGLRRTWRMKKGNYKRNDGSWEAWPWDEAGQRTILLYRIDVDPDMVVPDALLRKAQTGSLPDMFAAIRKRVGG